MENGSVINPTRTEAPLSVGEIRELEIDILVEVSRVCEVLGLEYFLTYGSLWGAVTEGGFLSDDDDIDIILPRRDYEMLIEHFDECALPPYRLLSLASCRTYYYAFAKVTDTRTLLREKGLPDIPGLGVSIDVFPLDGMPRRRIRSIFHSLRLRLLHNARYWAILIFGCLSKGRLKGAGSAVVRFLAERYDRAGRCVPVCTDGWVSCNIGGRIDAAVFGSRVDVQFEGRRFPAPCGYHRYLSRLYGDYETAARNLGTVPAHGALAFRRSPQCGAGHPGATAVTYG